MTDTWKGNDYQAVWFDEAERVVTHHDDGTESCQYCEDGPHSDTINEILDELIEEGVIVEVRQWPYTPSREEVRMD